MKKFLEYNNPEKFDIEEELDILAPQIDEALYTKKHSLNALQSFSNTYTTFNENIKKIEEILVSFENLNKLTDSLVSKEEIESIFLSHLLLVNESIHEIKSDLQGINEQDLASIRSYVDSIDDKTVDLIEHINLELPKTKKSIVENDILVNRKISDLKDELIDLSETLTESLDTINDNTDVKFNTLDSKLDTFNSSITEDIQKEKNERLKLSGKLTELYDEDSSNRKKITNKLTELYDDVISINGNIESLSEKYNEFTPVFEKINKLESDLSSVSFDYSESLQQTKKEISSVINEVNTIFINDKYIELDRKVEKIEEIFDKLSEKILINENDEPVLKPAAKQYSDEELAKLDRGASFQQPNPELVEANFKAVQTKMRFLEQAIGRIAATGPGGGEVNLRWLDDIDRTTIADGLFLRYNDTKKKFEFSETAATSTSNASNITSGTLGAARLPQFTGGDVTTAASGTTALVLSTATNTGITTQVGSSSTVPVITVSNKGLVSEVTSVTITPSAIGALSTLVHGTIGSGILTTTSIASQIIDSNPIATYRSVKYEIQITSSGSYQVCEAIVVHDGTNASIVEYGNVNIGTLTTSLATFDANISSGNMNLVVIPAQATSTVFKIIKTLINI